MKQEKLNNWVAVIPSIILYNNDLSDKDKLVFAVISNLTHEKGYCWASNRYIAELLGCSPITISRSISKLNFNGIVKNELLKDDHGTNRKIYINMSYMNKGFIKNDIPSNQKRQANNITNNIKKEILNKHCNLSKEILDFINLGWNRNFRTINTKKLQQRLKLFKIEQIKLAIKNAYEDKYHRETNWTYLTPEYFMRNDDNIDKWLNKKTIGENEQIRKTKSKTSNYTENISKELGW